MLLNNYSELRIELKVALGGGDNEGVATRFPLLIVSARVDQQVFYENFNDVPAQKIEYGQVMDIPSMKLSVFTPSAYAEIRPSGGIQGTDGMILDTVTAVSLDLKFQCKSVRFVFMFNLFTPTTYRFYNNKGLEIGQAMPTYQSSGMITWEYKAPPGQLFSKIVAEARGVMYFDNFVFQL